uniref:N-acetylglucosamine-6-phosphate deacetylase n=1 Tax=Strix occidentalis caurina TaxID=311401 RepID=A0A8D0EUE2_STROC
MPSNKSVSDAPIVQFTNCRILRSHQLQREDLWVREGKILNPEKLFFDEKGSADIQLDCKDSIIAPGFIDVQINGGFGVDFSLATDDFKSGIDLVSQKILSHGVTSFCPTLVTSPPPVYHQGPIWKDHSSARRRKGHTRSIASAPLRQVPSRTCLPPTGPWTVSG